MGPSLLLVWTRVCRGPRSYDRGIVDHALPLSLNGSYLNQSAADVFFLRHNEHFTDRRSPHLEAEAGPRVSTCNHFTIPLLYFGQRQHQRCTRHHAPTAM